MNAEIAERYQQGVINQRMQILLDDDLREMRLYESMVPEDFRTPEKITEILSLIKEEKAKTVDEACAMLA